MVEVDQCMFGLKTWGKDKSQLMLAKKPTRFMTNSQALGRELARRCDNTHEHQPLLDGRAKDAARYPPGLCRAICRGISKEKMQRACGIAAVLSIREGIHLTSIDPEEHHDRTEVDIEALIRRIEGEAQADREVQEEQAKDEQARKGNGSPSAPSTPTSARAGPSGSVR